MIHRIVPSTEKDFSPTTLAYIRHQSAGDSKVSGFMLTI
jgi:hypothetical protein